MKLQGKVAIVTGAGSGMGRAIALRYAAEGAKVVAADYNLANANLVVEEIKAANGVAMSYEVDVSNEEQVQKMVDATVEAYGTLDILVNNAGIMDNFVPVGDLSTELFDRVLGVNLYGPFYASRAALQVMLPKGKGVIISTASVGGMFGSRGGAAYVTSKHALIGMTRNIAATYGVKGIRANAIAPGGVNTNIGNTITAPNPIGLEAIGRSGSEHAPSGNPEEIAGVALFLASDDASFVNGTVVTADGGWTAH